MKQYVMIPSEIQRKLQGIKIPQYLQNSYSFMTHFNIWREIFGEVMCFNANILLNLLRIFEEDYVVYLSEVDWEIYPEMESFDIIDKIGSIFGVSRHFKITYEDEGEIKTEELSLNIPEYLILIKTQIVKNYCEGTREQIEEYYKSVGLNVFVQTSEISGIANLYLTGVVSPQYLPYTDNIKKMFLGGMFTIQSMGIKYKESLLNTDRLLIWDSGNWDEGEWSV